MVHNYTQNERISNERDNRERAGTYLIAARYCYVLWDAADKVKQLDENYPELSANQSRDMPGTDSQRDILKKTGSTGSSTTDAFDLETVVRASQSLSSEIEIEKLLKEYYETVYRECRRPAAIVQYALTPLYFL